MGVTKSGLANNGFTPRYEFRYDESLRGLEPGRLNDVIRFSDNDLDLMSGWFGYEVHQDNTVTVVASKEPGNGGAQTTFTPNVTLGEDDITIVVYNKDDSTAVRYLLIAEMSEVYMRGNNPVLPGPWFGDPNEGSNGEALSHFLAARFLVARNLERPAIDFQLSNVWLNSPRIDYVNVPDRADNQPDARTGCGLLFLNYLYSQLGFSIEQIIAAGSPTLADCYRRLTGASDDPFPAFKALIDSYFPGTNTISGLDPNNPFPLAWPRQLFGGQGVVYVAPGVDGALRVFRRPGVGPWKADVGYWFGPDVLTSAGKASPGSTVGLGAQGAHLLDAVWVGLDGGLHVVWSVEHVPAWQGPVPIRLPGVADPGATVSLAAQGSNQLDAVYIGLDGALHVVWATEGVPNWQGPQRISPTGIADPSGSVALCAQGPHQLDAVYVGLDGGLHVVWATEGVPNWQGPGPVIHPGLVDPRSTISLVADGLHLIDGVYVGLDGAIYTFWVAEGVDGWQGPQRISPHGVADPSGGASITTHSLHALDVVYAGIDSLLYTLWADPGDHPWQGPAALTGAVVDPGAPLRLIAQNGRRLDAVFVDLDGEVQAVGGFPDPAGGRGDWKSTGTFPIPFDGSGAGGAGLAAAAHGAGLVELFGRGRDSAYYHRRFDGSGWPLGWESLGGVFTGPPAAVVTGSSIVHLFGRGRDSAYYHRRFDGSGWPLGWESLGGVWSSPPAVVVAAGALHVFGRGNDSAYYHRVLDAVTGKAFAGWESLDGEFTGPPAVADYGGINVFGRYLDGSCVRRTFDGHRWLPDYGWEDLGGVFTSPLAVTSTASALFAGHGGVLSVVGRGRDSSYYVRSLNGTHGWTPGWEPLGGVFTSPPVAVSTALGVEVLGRGRDSALYQRSLRGTTWNPPIGWNDLGGVFSDP